MKKLAGIAALSFLFATLGLAEQITGYVSESHCGAKHHEVSDANTKCINVCLKGGSDPVLVKDGNVMTFDGDSKDKAKAFAGQNVTIDGSMEGTVVKISSIEKAQ